MYHDVIISLIFGLLFSLNSLFPLGLEVRLSLICDLLIID